MSIKPFQGPLQVVYSGYLQLNGLSGLSAPERRGWIPIESISWGIKLSDREETLKDSVGNSSIPHVIRTGLHKQQSAVLKFKAGYLAESAIQNFMTRILAGSDGVPGKILVSPGNDMVVFPQGLIQEYSLHSDATIRILIEFGRNWQIVPAARMHGRS